MTASERSIELVRAAAHAAAAKKAQEIIALDVSEQLVITDAFVLASGANERQVRSIVDAVEDALRGLDAKPARREGVSEGRWVLLDFVDIVVHVQQAEDRVYYALERLWKDCPVIEVPGLAEQIAAAATGDDATPGSYATGRSWQAGAR